MPRAKSRSMDWPLSPMDAGGKLSIKEAPDDLTGTALGSLVGALVGVLGGPAGVVVGMTTGMMLGSISDLFNIGVAPTSLTRCLLSWLRQGRVIAEVDEDWVTPLNTRMEAIGGSVRVSGVPTSRTIRSQKETAARKAELAQLKS